jgi:proline dehydrogenase
VILRRGLLWLSERDALFKLVRSSRLARSFAARFVAGESVDDAIRVAGDLAAKGLGTTLDLLGESVHQAADAAAAAGQYRGLLDRLAEAGREVNASLKLTQMGLDLDPDLCGRNVTGIVQRARDHRGFVRIDMEGSDYTDRTLDFFEERLAGEYGAHVGVVIQTMLRRSAQDVERLIGLGARVRLVKGAYLEPPDLAFPDKADVDAEFVRLMERLLEAGRYPAIATHDERILDATVATAERLGLGPERFEFQMLFGVRRDLQQRLIGRGWRVRVYVPFGTQWYPYLMRRLAERPANIAFILGNVVREGFGRS